MLYKIAFSPLTFDAKPEPGDANLRKLSDTFVNVERPATLIADAIESYHPFTFWFNGRRAEANFVCGQHIAIDLDDGKRSYADLCADTFTAKFASFIYPTLSNTEQFPKYRVLFLLDTPIYQVQNMRNAISALMWVYGNADPHCKDAARFFFGAGDGFGKFFGNVLPLEKVRELISAHEEYDATMQQQAQAHRPAGGKRTIDGNKLLDYWAERIRTAAKGERNVELNNGAYACGIAALEGKLVEDEIRSALGYAGRANGLSDQEIDRTVSSGLRAAKTGA